jgi:hypothetical protein
MAGGAMTATGLPCAVIVTGPDAARCKVLLKC